MTKLSVYFLHYICVMCYTGNQDGQRTPPFSFRDPNYGDFFGVFQEGYEAAGDERATAESALPVRCEGRCELQ